MSRIPFTVSARAARLIGRENVATSQGAITELVKNAYDADATVCAILFTPSDGRVRDQLSEGGFEALSSVYPNAEDAYPLTDDVRVLRSDLSAEVRTQLAAAFAKIPDLWIIDNGRGMSTDTIAKQWMVIGTDSKEVDGLSAGGRVMTGAKGIGRFALDRLGQAEYDAFLKVHEDAAGNPEPILDFGDQWLAPRLGLNPDGMKKLRSAWLALRAHRLRHSGRPQDATAPDEAVPSLNNTSGRRAHG